jgi:hypothetical protein
MQKTNYTPGPWKCKNVFLDNEPNHYIVGEDKWAGRNVADCGMSGEGEWDTNEANARLIAAAPRMIRALQLLAGNGISQNEDGLIVFSGCIADFNDGMALANEIVNELE